MSRIAIGGEDLVGFLKRFDQSYQTGAWIDASSVMVIYACRFGTAALWVAALIAGVVMRFYHKLIAQEQSLNASRGSRHAQAAPRHLGNA